ncbi:ABC transporter ATP-binding protein [Lapillicoccus jejuensis]|uniref:ATP-binding cassette subfamily B protein n=1 Tax=Lapillicoccus jejuensis TaxID=402171 RepID=A0A542E6U2_9MICO|nr:ABC transporter ATP-binding protein [Lapillicoccus jejuensis]TQJ11048.1 ATP-binding cassette subfamily B protein [Lapillicoccus jejuensis]
MTTTTSSPSDTTDNDSRGEAGAADGPTPPPPPDPGSARPGERQVSAARALWRMAPYMRPYVARIVVMMVAALGGVGASIVVPLVTQRVVDGPIAHGDRAGLLPLGLLAIGLGLAEAVLVFVRRWVQNVATFGIETRMRDDLYRHLQALPPSFHDRWQSGQLLSRATSDLSAIRRFTGFGVVFLVVNTATFVTIVALLIHLDPLLGVVVAVCLAPVVVLCQRFERRYRVVSRRVQDQEGDLTTLIEESVTGLRVIKAFGRRQMVLDRYVDAARGMRETQLDKARLRGGLIAFLDLVPNAALVVVLLLGAYAVGEGRMTLGALVAFITLVLQLVVPVEMLGFILASAQEAATATTRFFEVLDAEPDIADRPGATDLPDGPGHVRLEGVGFAYDERRGAVLDGVDLDLRPGETLALAGASGSGKTTLAMLLPRLADPTSGRVTIDGQDIRDVTLRSLRTAASTAFEEPILFSASVRENVTLGHPDATDEQVAQALDLAQAGFAYDLPWGLDTRVGEQGMSLSGGQRQRLALARAVLGRPRVLVLDDPLSALDVETEHLVEEALRRVLATTTALIVVHRPSTVALADRVALLHEGRVVAVGTHAELLATVPEYADVLGQDEHEEVA